MTRNPLYLSELGSLREIRGVGNKIAMEMESYFGSEEKALEKIKEGDIASLTRVPGLSEGKASRILRNIISEEYGADDLLRTEVAETICENILDRIRGRACTDYGKAKLGIYFPISSESRIKEVRDWIRKALQVELVEDVKDSLGDVSLLEEASKPDLAGRALVTADAEKFERAREEFRGEVSVELAKNSQEMRKIIQSYERVILIDDAKMGVGNSSQFMVHNPEALENPLEVVPERVLNFFTKNRETIRSAIDVWEKVENAPLDFFENLEREELDRVDNMISRLNSGGEISDDEDLRNIKTSIEKFDAAITDAESKVNEEIKNALEEKEIRIEGPDILNLVKDEEKMQKLLLSEFEDEYDKVVEGVTGDLISDLDLDFEKGDLAWSLFSEEPEYPVEIDEEMADRLKSKLRREYYRKSLHIKIELARELEKYIEDVKELVEDVLELDVILAIRDFAEEYEMSLPEFSEDGFSIEGGRNILLRDPDPIDYEGDGVALLTGVNSGGKTSTLDLVAQVYVLAHMGFPVPADRAELELVDKIYYYRPAKRTMNSGAFEGALRKFEELLDSNGRKLVLVDELENITEPGASARIISGILEILKRDGETAVFVSHLAEKVRKEAKCEIRVDGIEAEGLDENMNLIVNRTPKKDLLATSTPELVVKKLSNQNNSEFYGELLEKFR